MALKPANAMVGQHFVDDSMDTVNELEQIHLGVGKPIGHVLHTWAGGADPSDTVAVPGAQVGDVVQACLSERNASQIVATAIVSAPNVVTVTLSANGQDDTCVLNVSVFRPA